MPAPALDDDLRLAQRIEDLAVEKFVAQASIKALDEAVLPWAAGSDVGRLCPDGADPILHGFGDELGAVVGTDVASRFTLPTPNIIRPTPKRRSVG